MSLVDKIILLAGISLWVVLPKLWRHHNRWYRIGGVALATGLCVMVVGLGLAADTLGDDVTRLLLCIITLGVVRFLLGQMTGPRMQRLTSWLL
jgi:hypothetical protein